MVRIQYESELSNLKVRLLRMVSVVESMISDGVKGLETADRALCESVVKRDKDVDNYESLIEKECLHLFLKQTPVAKDFREISAILKIITDLERIGDQAADICEIALMLEKPYIKVLADIMDMAGVVREMVEDGVKSFIGQDTELAVKVMRRDGEADGYFERIKGIIIRLLKEERDSADQAVYFLMIAKYLERIADHATNICEWGAYSAVGEKLKETDYD